MSKLRVWWIPQVGADGGAFQIWNEEESEWEDWWMETEDDYFDDVDDYCEQCEKADELENFRSKLFKQIDWDKIHKMTM